MRKSSKRTIKIVPSMFESWDAGGAVGKRLNVGVNCLSAHQSSQSLHRTSSQK